MPCNSSRIFKADFEKLILKCIWKYLKNLKEPIHFEKEQSYRISTPWLQFCCLVERVLTVTETIQYCLKTDKWIHEAESEIDTRIVNWFLAKMLSQFNGKRILFSTNGVEKSILFVPSFPICNLAMQCACMEGHGSLTCVSLPVLWIAFQSKDAGIVFVLTILEGLCPP
jgi:hypothetical protein